MNIERDRKFVPKTLHACKDSYKNLKITAIKFNEKVIIKQ